jgi:ribose 1,5-bisphosphate isomerase
MSDIFTDIKEIKIQGAINIAKAAIKDIEQYSKTINYKTKTEYTTQLKDRITKLIELRPTEPALQNSLKNILKQIKSKKETDLKKLTKNLTNNQLKQIENNQKQIAINGSKLFKKNTTFLIHCHSHTVIDIIKKCKNPIVYTTETRPKFQGRLTAKDLCKLNINTTQILDSAIADIIHKIDVVLVGADAITKKGIINKIGTNTISQIAYLHKKPVYSCSDTLKIIPKSEIELRDEKEVWDKKPKNLKIDNYAFDLTKWKYITGGVITEKGLLKKSDILY